MMRSNLAKCAFAIKKENFLGFVVSMRGVETNPKKNTSYPKHDSFSIIKGCLKVNRKNHHP